MLYDYQLKDIDSGCTVLQQGIILNNMFQLFGIEWQDKAAWENYPDFESIPNPRYDPKYDVDTNTTYDDNMELWRGSYGVCDCLDNLLEVYPELKTSEKQYVVNLCCINKDEQPDEGGWRWHKWGVYIGNQIPTTEYIYHEPLIEQVFCYHIYEKKA